MIPAPIHWVLMKRDNAKKDAIVQDAVLEQYTPAGLAAMEEYSPLVQVHAVSGFGRGYRSPS